MKTSYLFLAEGFEEVEALSVVDVLRRSGAPILTVSVTGDAQVKGAHGIIVTADTVYADADFSDANWLILPGGLPGAPNLAAFEPLCELLKAHYAKGGNVAAICASPAVVLAPLGILDGKEAICYPGFETAFNGSTTVSAKPVVIDGNLITANGPASAMVFALAIANETVGPQDATTVAEGLLFYDRHEEFYF